MTRRVHTILLMVVFTVAAFYGGYYRGAKSMGLVNVLGIETLYDAWYSDGFKDGRKFKQRSNDGFNMELCL